MSYCILAHLNFNVLYRIQTRKTSYINNKIFPPWLDGEESHDRFAYPVTFQLVQLQHANIHIL